jgi:hypothetical protein
LPAQLPPDGKIRLQQTPAVAVKPLTHLEFQQAQLKET